MRSLPDPTHVASRIAYDPETGVLTWKSAPPRGREIGDRLRDCDNGNGYRYVKINSHPYAAHRVAWCVMTGQWPPGEVDHINCQKADNRWVNLRLATRSQNQQNMPVDRKNTSGFKGVGWHKCKQRWRAYIQVDGRQISLGYHPDAEAAHRAYCAAAEKYFGDYARAA
jgi:hypothetical protein